MSSADTVSSWFTAGVSSLMVSEPDRLIVDPGRQDDRLVGELQALDVPQRIGAVGAGIGADIVRDGGGAVRASVMTV